MNIAVILPSLDVWGGAESMLISLSRSWSIAGHSVTILVPRFSIRDKMFQMVPSHVRIVSLNSYPSSRLLNSIMPLRLYLNCEKPDILLTSTYMTAFTSALAKILSNAPTKIVVGAHCPLKIHKRPLAWPRDFLAIRLFDLLFRVIDLVVSVSLSLSDEISNLLPTCESRLLTIHNPIDLERINSLAKQPIDARLKYPQGGVLNLIAVGRLVQEKNYPCLLMAINRVLAAGISIRLVIIGEGPKKSELQSLANQLLLQDVVTFLGFDSNPYKYMRRSDLYICSSESEGFCISLLEAIALGLPVISTDCKHGPREILDGGRYGVLVKPNDPNLLAEEIIRHASFRSNVASEEELKRRAEDFALCNVSSKYLEAFYSVLSVNN